MSVLSYFRSYIISLETKEGEELPRKLLGSMTATINIFKWFVANTVLEVAEVYLHGKEMKQ